MTPRAAVASDLLYLFDRPAEPVFTLRGLRRDTAFDVPDSYLVRSALRLVALFVVHVAHTIDRLKSRGSRSR